MTNNENHVLCSIGSKDDHDMTTKDPVLVSAHRSTGLSVMDVDASKGFTDSEILNLESDDETVEVAQDELPVSGENIRKRLGSEHIDEGPSEKIAKSVCDTVSEEENSKSSCEIVDASEKNCDQNAGKLQIEAGAV